MTLCALQASLASIDLPVERLGYTYIVCAAGGALAFDGFAGSVVEQRQSVTSDLRRLSRSFIYSTTVRSVVDPAVLHRCGSIIEMNVCEDYSKDACRCPTRGRMLLCRASSSVRTTSLERPPPSFTMPLTVILEAY